MAQKGKKRRRLKKKVRRGCMSLLALVVLISLLAVYKCRQGAHGDDEVLPVAVADSLPDARDSLLAFRLAKAVSSTPRIDSSRVGMMVFDLTHRSPVFSHRSDRLMVPASCQKLLTALSVLHRLGATHSFVSQLYMQGEPADSVLYGSLLLVADDDPLIYSFEGFAQAIQRKGIRRIEGDVFFDLARYDTLRPHPSAPAWDIPYRILAPLFRGEEAVRRDFIATLASFGIRLHRNPLFADRWLEGLSRKDYPHQYALASKAAQLRSHEVFRVEHSLREVLAPMLIYSDNAMAEAVYHHADHSMARWSASRGEDGQTMESFIRDELEGLVPEGMTAVDGSGLSPLNATTAEFLVQLLKYAYDKPALRDELIGYLLATPHHDERFGTLWGRRFDERFRERLYCKTGTLTARGISSLAGYLHSEDGRWYAFAILNEGTPVYEAREFQDAVCRSLLEH